MAKDVRNNVLPMDDSDKLFDFLPTFSLEQNCKLLAQQVAQQVLVKIKQNSGGSILKKTKLNIGWSDVSVSWMKQSSASCLSPGKCVFLPVLKSHRSTSKSLASNHGNKGNNVLTTNTGIYVSQQCRFPVMHSQLVPAKGKKELLPVFLQIRYNFLWHQD